MEIHLTPEQESFVRHAIDAGRFDTPEQAVSEALNSLAERERQLLALRAEIQIGIDQLDRGEGILLESTEDLYEFFEDIKRKGRERLSKDTSSKA